MKVDSFPKEGSALRMDTVAYQAERELDTILYQDSGMYRDHQYKKAVSVTLRSTYEEIGILWDEELKYRPNFRTSGDTVDMPVIFAKVSGVKEGKVPGYSADIRKMLTSNSFLIRQMPFLRPEDRNPVKSSRFRIFQKRQTAEGEAQVSFLLQLRFSAGRGAGIHSRKAAASDRSPHYPGNL